MRSSRVVTVLLQICILVFSACLIGAIVLAMFEAVLPEKLFQTLMPVLCILAAASIAVFFPLLFIYSFIYSRQKKHREKQAKKAAAEATQFARKAGAYHTYVPPVTPPPAAPPPVAPPPQPPEAETVTAQTASAVPPTTAATGQPSSSAVPPVTPPPTPQSQPSQDTTKPEEPVKKALGNKTLRWILIVIAVLIVLRLVIAVVPVISSGDGFSTASIVQVCQNLFQDTAARKAAEESADTVRSGSSMNFLSLVVFVFIGFFILRRLNLGKLFQPLPDAVTNQIILEELRRGFGETASYQKGAGISASQLEKIRNSGVFPEGFSYQGRECFSGVFQGKPFEAAVFTCVINKRHEDGATFQEVLFSGLWIQREMQHYATEPVGLRSATVKEIEAEIMENGLKTPEGLEVEAFNRLFRVPSKDLHEVYYLITPDQMEQLAALYQRFGCDAKGRLWLLFSENQVQYGLNTNFTLYQFQGTKNEPASLAQARSRVAAKVQEAMQLMALYDTLGF
ncbi:DUF3137 domain-containing protein [Ruminococcus sp.]|uniref:DUF3137 domain-containing protein n=1 Tax=Ruminococcus sp. TaxID=41978 RepID=UPI0025F0C101|nr:DUF3137 domain-containing protein [Ruminococcus sp.]